MDWDLLLAIAHHLSVFALVAVFAAEWALFRPGLGGKQVRQLARIDAAYGALAGVVIVVGIIRVIFAAKGWDYYSTNHSFWGKMIAFALMGILSVPPTIAIRRWVKAGGDSLDYVPPAAEISRYRRFLHFEALALLFIPIFAAAMARGYGS
jgi:putative membrane protein